MASAPARQGWPVGGVDAGDAGDAVATHGPGLPIERVGTCRILSEIAPGGTAVVYRAEQPSLGRRVAVKALLTEAVHVPAVRARFLREAALLSRFQHPGLPQLHELCAEYGTLFMILELIEGPDLYALLERGRPLPAEVAGCIALGVAQALAHLHAGGVVHRDVKPANVLLSPAGAVKLCDLGLALELRRDGREAADAGLGTPGYAAPEQLRGAPPDARADQYALGAVLYQMLTGQKPAASGEAGAGAGPPRPRPSELLLRVAERCLSPDPAVRFPTTPALVAALVQAAPVPAPQARLVRFLRDEGYVTRDAAAAALQRIAAEAPPDVPADAEPAGAGGRTPTPGSLVLVAALAALAGALLAALVLLSTGRAG